MEADQIAGNDVEEGSGYWLVQERGHPKAEICRTISNLLGSANRQRFQRCIYISTPQESLSDAGKFSSKEYRT